MLIPLTQGKAALVDDERKRGSKMVNYIGIGAYTLQEAALYGSLSSNKLSRWAWGMGVYPPVIEAQLRNEKLISFYDLVQAMAIDKARAYVPLPKIRQAIEYAKKKYGVQLPLAYKHELWFFDNDLHIKFPNDTVVQVSGKQKGQTAIELIVEPYKKDLTFDTAGFVQSYMPFTKFGRDIVLDPKKQFGQPLVGDTGYRADVLDNAFVAEKSVDSVASIYGVDVRDVKVAVAYMDKIRNAA